ncbi:DUF4363 family protein [Pseudoflavonifractor phocaeensis]|uniref:DUF4363 family protein n=1 Tax=Pseudoflavonifractor phocaeensis TaxID=1870988 RepID=UPI001F18275B|nr:DUF4363 family protein [Pseudoflavonifractor phocaeensis]MCF2660616.1 DUF4363 family protein [Pseudoflavonifractor phocaeensis]
MKRLWIAAALMAAMLAGSLANAWYAQALCDGLNQKLALARELAQAEAWDRAEELTREVYQVWQDHHFYLHTVMRHSDTDSILRSFRSVLQYLKLEEMDQYAAANADLMAQIELLAEMEQASVVNVL